MATFVTGEGARLGKLKDIDSLIPLYDDPVE